ncbi:ABC transporter permease [Lactobacillus hominis]|nr:ABC transporter permease [Lactobacillus hominis]MCT3347301.1 ABC transporter permease [Lactobacillus hominis]
MYKKILFKDAFQSLGGSLGRFIGIMLLMMVSAFAFIGLKMAGPDMRTSAQNFYNQTNLADMNVLTNYGLDAGDVAKINQQARHAQVEYSYLQDTTIKNHKNVIRIFSLSQSISKPELLSGHLPKRNNEIVLSNLQKNKYKIGQKIILNNYQLLKNSKFKIVGFVRPSDYTDKTNIGQTNIGAGQLDEIAYVRKNAFRSKNYQIAKIRFEKSKKMDSFSDTYQDFVDTKKKSLEENLKKRAVQKNSTLQSQITQNQQKLDLAKMNGINVVSAQPNLDRQKSLFKQLGPVNYVINDRKADSGYATFYSNAEKIELITNIFPVFLFAVAALVSLTAMTRFIDDQRQNIGVLRALGYTKFDACLKFVVYSLIASIIGVAIGSIGGFLWLPKIIFNSYTSNLTLTNFKAGFSWYYLFLTFLIAILCTTIAALIQLVFVLRQKPSELLLPKAPKNGSHIWLEKIQPLWNRLNFNYKVTIRNIFRYKVKMLMTILGVAGCTGLLIMGFGIKDSLVGISHKQYGEITKYDIIAIQKSNLKSSEKDKLEKVLSSNQIKSHTPIYLQQLTKRMDNTEQSIFLLVPQDSSQFDKYFVLKNRKSQKKIELKNNTVVISEKLAKLLNAHPGGRITLKQNDGKNISLKVGQICEMYMGHYILMNMATYNKYFHKKVRFNSQLIKTNASNQNKEVARKLLKTQAIQSVNLNTSNKKIIDNLVQSMNKVMFLLIALAALLAVIVIFTLTSANLEERTREISTVKVLGFFNNEVTMYIYRETIILSIIGILVGFLIGNWLHSFIIDNLAPLNMMFDPRMLWTNYLLSALIPIVITLVLSYFVYRKIKDIDMLKALQAVD